MEQNKIWNIAEILQNEKKNEIMKNRIKDEFIMENRQRSLEIFTVAWQKIQQNFLSK